MSNQIIRSKYFIIIASKPLEADDKFAYVQIINDNNEVIEEVDVIHIDGTQLRVDFMEYKNIWGTRIFPNVNHVPQNNLVYDPLTHTIY